MREVYRILDANFNRAREALRVAEDCGRFALNDPAVTAMAKNMRSDLQELLAALPVEELIAARDTAGDIGTEITSPTEPTRKDLPDVAVAACKRLTEALRSVEEYSKMLAPDLTLKVERMRYNAYTLEQRLLSRFLVARRFRDVELYVLVSSRLCARSLTETARAAIAGGAGAIQLREKDTPDAAFVAMAAELRELTDETGRLFLVNDRPDIAAIVGADGVHLGQEDLPIAETRRLLRPHAIVGRSAHNLQQARAAVNEGADYVSIGPMFETATKDAGPIAGPEVLQSAAAEIGLPLVAIGGINPENVGDLAAVGATCVAVSSAVCCAPNPQTATETLKKRFHQALADAGRDPS